MLISKIKSGKHQNKQNQVKIDHKIVKVDP